MKACLVDFGQEVPRADIPRTRTAGKGAVYSYDPVGSFEREGYRAGGTGTALLQPLLDSEVLACPHHVPALHHLLIFHRLHLDGAEK